MFAHSQVHAQVQSALKESQACIEGVVNPKLRDLTFQVGDCVWLSAAHLPLRVSARKLSPKWAGPFAGESQVSREAYRLTLPQQWRVHPVFLTGCGKFSMANWSSKTSCARNITSTAYTASTLNSRDDSTTPKHQRSQGLFFAFRKMGHTVSLRFKSLHLL